MRAKIIFWINFLWTSFVAFSFPICFELIFLDLTGHSKGYSYDLGPEKDVSVMFGCAELLVWFALALPSIIYVFRRIIAKNRACILVPIVLLYIALAVCCVICLYGGWALYAKEVFNI